MFLGRLLFGVVFFVGIEYCIDVGRLVLVFPDDLREELISVHEIIEPIEEDFFSF